MAKNITQRPLIFQDENFDVSCKKPLGGEISLSSKQSVVKKGGAGRKSRGALFDITNKSAVQPKASQKKSVSHKKKLVFKEDEVNIEEETVLHDHKKCIEAQEAITTLDLFDIAFPKLDSIEISDMKPEESIHCGYPEPEELPTAEDSKWLQSCLTWKSPPSSPTSCGSPLSPIWEFEPVEFKMKEEIDLSV
ncbi:unnamed protein product [Cuscuta campestris]|uniref:Uncharacterized protein n=2 Tax=Cuscuta sect. Cleistogrammica TaxID=1824901 RepID=A0A484KF98_9ASTE|nr:hypothetical protein DM860_014680 [Cuscuta australis]VFQ61867.1 unnamed protein product [Cuscuta campestris]